MPYRGPIIVFVIAASVIIATPAAAAIISTPAAAIGLHHTGGDRQQNTDESHKQSWFHDRLQRQVIRHRARSRRFRVSSGGGVKRPVGVLFMGHAGTLRRNRWLPLSRR